MSAGVCASAPGVHVNCPVAASSCDPGGKSRNVPSVANGIGYEITPRKVWRLPASQWPRCPTA